MNFFFSFTYLFLIGAFGGWVLELFYRRFFSAMNPERKWINPGFCAGPYLPIYGFGLTGLFLLSVFCEKNFMKYGWLGYLLLFVFMAIAMTLIELVAGATCLRFFQLRLWDYKNEWANYKGLICPKFSFFWTLGGIGYYFLLHPHIQNWIDTLLTIVPLLFLIGMVYGMMILDFIHSAELVSKIRAFAKEHEVVINYESLKAQIRHTGRHLQKKVYFMTFFKAELGIRDILEKFYDESEARKKQLADALNAEKQDMDIIEKLKDAFEVFEERRWKRESK